MLHVREVYKGIQPGTCTSSTATSSHAWGRTAAYFTLSCVFGIKLKPETIKIDGKRQVIRTRLTLQKFQSAAALRHCTMQYVLCACGCLSVPPL